MRDFDHAVGKIVSCCSAMGADYSGGLNQNGQHVVEIKHRGNPSVVWAHPTDAHFTAQTTRSLSNVDGFDLTKSKPVVNIESSIRQEYRELDLSIETADTVTEMNESESLEYFDGFIMRAPLYVYDDNFGASELDQSLSRINRLCASLFRNTLNEVGIDIEEADEAAGSGGKTERNSNVAFQ